MKINISEVAVRQRRLPHWEKEGGTYFITFRLAGYIPQDALEEAKRTLDARLTPEHQKQQVSRWLDAYLDQTSDALLRNLVCAQIVQDCLLFWHTKRYRMLAWCVMPNHVHAVLRVLPSSSLEEILHTWKSYTAHEINKALDRRGQVWQREYFDRLLRNEEETVRAIRYTVQNPQKAGLQGWEFVGSIE